ncbi:RBP11-like subunits of RNA polymerase [Gonapodya prolifera JEL478]|uniref:RBP11-like subunits of RNA polymerase n=1 Tax=Gonapodya prolifera (strain JEL478) TaxID=1344416 RepID=A0A139ANV1_GONPJ|nr:RBP11-like subunits of RNA polymerase [Gonapodya prolifera JEL478]|eukprot:KXS18431.1 RBP11-like subunits of RNA polymerase [Gonapodya prolifera JEL478]
MNAPDRAELNPEGVKPVTVVRDTKIPNAATFTLQAEDHTVGNVLRQQLLRNPRVLFAGYRVPHPLEQKVEIKVQTVPTTTPVKVMVEDIQAILRNSQTLINRFETACTAGGVTRLMDPNLYGTSAAPASQSSQF